MSNLELPRPPAFSTLRPGQPQHEGAEPHMKARILKALGVDGEVHRLTGREKQDGCFIVVTPGSPKLLLKLIPDDLVDRQRVADKLSVLAGKSADASKRVFETRVDQYAAFAYPYVEGRRAGAVVSDMFAIGQAIAEVHQAFRASAPADQVRDAARNWLTYLDGVAERVLRDEVAGYPAKASKCLAQRTVPLNAYVDASASQVLHGDLNFGNVLIGNTQNADVALILDFENAARSFGPVGLDLLFALERFCFPLKTDETVTQELAVALLSGYTSVSALTDMWLGEIDADAVLTVIMIHSWRALAVLAAQVIRGDNLQAAEVEKFLMLLRDAPRKAAIITRAMDAIEGGHGILQVRAS